MDIKDLGRLPDGTGLSPSAEPLRVSSAVAASIPSAGMSPELVKLLADLKAARGSPQDWLARETALTRFIANLRDEARVFCRGEVRHPDKGHFPAVLIYNRIHKQVMAWAPSGRKNGMEGHHEAFFYSGIPHVGIARDVLSGPEGTEPASAMSARSAETEGLSPQDASAARQGDAQSTPGTPHE